MARITRAGRSDLPELVELLGRLFSIEQDFQAETARQRRGLELLIRMPRRARVLVARDGSGRAIGLASAQLVISTSEGTFSAWIEDVIVAENHRAQLLVDIDNVPALSFYDRLGWQPTRLAARRIFLQAPARPKKNGRPAGRPQHTS